MRLQQAVIYVALALCLPSIQNCARASFGSSADSGTAEKSSLVPVETTGPTAGDTVTATEAPVDAPAAADGDFVACILVDHGKSLKLGLLAEKLDGVNSVAESICITKAECMGEVAIAFKVEGAYDRGYCEHNPHVQRLTDAQVHALLIP
jgi:hypothetical protein